MSKADKAATLTVTALDMAHHEYHVLAAEHKLDAERLRLAKARRAYLLARGWRDVSQCSPGLHNQWLFCPPRGRKGSPWCLTDAGPVYRKAHLAVAMERTASG